MITDATVEKRMKDLIKLLNNARYKYYSGENEESALTDKQYNAYLYELENLEEGTGIRMANSPIMMVGYEETEAKVEHYAPVLSLKDTKDIDELLRFLGDEDGVLSWKLDGVSIVLHYEMGKLKLALSRGDGHIGRDITKNVIFMNNVLRELPEKYNLIIRGEGCISITDFEKLKQTEEGEHYSNPRNLAAGLINRTRTKSVLLRSMTFVPHSIISLGSHNHRIQTRHKQLQYLEGLGFQVVTHSLVTNFELKSEIERYTDDVENYDYPVDGLVLSIDNIARGESRGTTSKFPKHSIAFKWPDTSALTKVVGMKWSMSNVGLLTPVVIFEPTQLEGTIIQQATLHNLKRFKDLDIGIGDIISVYKANRIIPQVEENLTRSKTEKYPIFCPQCGNPTYSVASDNTEKLYCWHCKENNEDHKILSRSRNPK